VTKLGVPDLHFHDPRHTGNTFAAESGATLRDLMERMGHDSVRAAMIYQHRAAGGDRAIATSDGQQHQQRSRSSANGTKTLFP
jgi:integrase